MLNKISHGIVAGVLVLCLSEMSYATYIGTGRQDNTDAVNDLVELYNLANDPDLMSPLQLLGKWQVDENAWENDFSSGFSGEFVDDAGTWFAPSSWDSSFSIYFSVKAGNPNSGGGFELYYADGATSGNWSINDLNDHDLSHISFWGAENESTPVPEPATMLLFGTGLIGLARARRMKK